MGMNSRIGFGNNGIITKQNNKNMKNILNTLGKF